MKIRQYFLMIILVMMAGWAFAQDEAVEAEGGQEEEVQADGEAPPEAPAAIYIPMKPQFVVNYGGKGKLRYLKTSVTLRLANGNAASSVRHHMPFIRNNLVMLFAAQTDETLESQEGREAMRDAALSEVRELLVREDQVPEEDVVDVLFNALTWH